MSQMKEWSLASLAIFGAFFIAGLTGSFITDYLGLWHLPGAGFAAALAVVLTTYFASPSHKFRSSCIALLVGAVVAWIFIEPSWYPDTRRYGDLAYQPTHLPFVATLTGGILGLLVAFLLRSRTAA